jgi:hypothetical protein
MMQKRHKIAIMEYQRITLRIPADLHQELMDAADKNSMSMNAAIIARLRATRNLPANETVPADSQPLTAEDVRGLALKVVQEELVLDKEDYDYPQAVKLIQHGAPIPMLRSLLNINRQTIVAIRNEHNIPPPTPSLSTGISVEEVERIYQEWEILGQPSDADGFLQLYEATGQPLSLLWHFTREWRRPTQGELLAIKAMERRNRRILVNQFCALLVCLLKHKYQISHSIKASQRTRIANQREDEIQRSFGEAYPLAVREIVEEFDLPKNLFPTECPWIFEQVISQDFWSEPITTPDERSEKEKGKGEK